MSDSAEITFDIVVSGCAADCRHCYVNGGPGALMELADYERVLAFVRAFGDAAKARGAGVYPYLDLEPMLHPQIARILELAHRTDSFSMPACIPTSGIPIATREDWADVLAAYREAGVRELELTLHGSEELHDRAVARKGAFRWHAEALRRARQNGFRTRLNLMLSRPMLRRFEETIGIVERNEYHCKRAVIPAYAPNNKLRRFEEQRPGLSDVLPYRDFLERFCDNRERDAKYWKNVTESTEEKAYAELLDEPEKYGSYRLLIERLPQWYFVAVGPDLDIWYGNGFHRTGRIGRIGATEPEEVLELVLHEYPNYSLGGYFQIDSLPHPAEVAAQVADPRGQRIYHERDEVHVKWLDDYVRQTA